MPPALALPATFGAALRLLRKRARLTQDELGRAVGYSREQIARLENGSRLPDLAVVAALFIPALLPERERELVSQFLALAGQSRSDQQVTVTHTRATRVQVVRETVSTPSHVPPAPLLPLIGRQVEVERLLTLLANARLITLVGAPGIGKTRLALAVAHAALSQFADGALFVSLAETQTADDIPYAVLRQLALTLAPPQTPTAAIEAYLKPRQLLLVLDNCEHLLDGVTLFADWLAYAPRLKLLCTSRVPLDLYGEQEWPLAPLAVPDLAEQPSPGWGDYPALQLLLARAQAADPDFALTDDNLLPLATLCVALDGLPLALELAAVRLRELAPALLVQQLLLLRGNAQLASTWLQQSRRNVADRHRTLQAAIAWSVRLLPPETQCAFERLGVFVGGGSETAAQAVAGATPAMLAHLARANLLQLANGRFQLLETVRTYAFEQLATDEQLLAGRQAHAHHYAQFAQAVFHGLLGDQQALWMQRALADQDNCLAGLRWALAQADGDTAVAIAGGLWWFWTRRGLFGLGRTMLTAALQLPSTDLTIRANALNGLANFCLDDGEHALALEHHAVGLALRRQLNDAAGIATVLHNMGLVAFVAGDYLQAMSWLSESIAADPQSDPTSAWVHMGSIAQETQDLAQARHYLELAYAAVGDSADSWLRAFVCNYLADVLRELGDFERACTLAHESARIFSALDDRHYLPDAQMTLAQIALDQGDFESAESLADVCYRQYQQMDNTAGLLSALLVQAELAAKQDQRALGQHLFGQASALMQSFNRSVTPHLQASFDTLERLLFV